MDSFILKQLTYQIAYSLSIYSNVPFLMNSYSLICAELRFMLDRPNFDVSRRQQT
jgi:hypothetical protein